MRTRRPVVVALLAVLLVAGTVVVWLVTRPKPTPPSVVSGPDLVVRVTATFPGADARTVADTVAAPIERHLHTAEGVSRLESESWDDGTYTLTVRVAAGTDPDVAVAVVQNRVNIALPQLPEEVQRQGVKVRKAVNGPPVVWVAVTSEQRSNVELSEVAGRLVVPALEKLPGVADVSLLGASERALRVRVDPDKLAARGLTTQDVVDALTHQNVQVTAGRQGDLTLITSARQVVLEKLEAVVVKTGEDARPVYLRDVARVESGAEPNGWAMRDGRRVVLIGITRWGSEPAANEVRTALSGLTGVPDGVKVEEVAGLSDGKPLAVEVQLLAGSREEETEEVTRRAGELVSGLPGVAGGVAFGESKQPNVATLLVSRTADRPTAAEVRKALAEGLPGALCRVSEATAVREPFPVRVAVYDPNGLGEQTVRRTAEQVADRWRADASVTDVLAAYTNTVTRTEVELDGDKAAALGVSVRDVFTALVATGGVKNSRLVNGRRVVQMDAAFRTEDLDVVRVRTIPTRTGDDVLLSKLVTVRKVEALPVIVRVDRHLAVIVSANPADGDAPATATRLLKETAAELPAGVQIIDLTRRR